MSQFIFISSQISGANEDHDTKSRNEISHNPITLISDYWIS